MEGAPGSEQPGVGGRCPFCGAAWDESSRCCPSCGRVLAGTAAGADIGNWVSGGWLLFLKNMPVAISIPLILIIPAIAFVMVCYLGVVGMAILSERASGALPVAPIVLGGFLGLTFLISLVSAPALQAGIYACFLQGIRTGKLSADNLWAGFRHWWACTWVTWLLGGAIVLCLPLFFALVGIPLFLGLLALHWLSLFRIVDKGSGGIDALLFAWHLVGGRLWSMLAYTLLVFTLMNIGVAGMYLGVLVTIPIGDAALAASYDSLSKEQELAPVP